MKKVMIFIIGFFNLFILTTAWANEIWKVTAISTLPNHPGISVEFCQQFSPNSYAAPIERLMQEGIKSQNGVSVKYRNIKRQEQHGLYFSEIEIILSRRIENQTPWFDIMYVHLQQLTANGPADGVWSTRRCKGRIIIQRSS